MTGKNSVYTLYEGHEIMFHVSTLLPFSRDNRQQVCLLTSHYNKAHLHKLCAESYTYDDVYNNVMS